MLRGVLLWMLGIPIPIIILLWLFLRLKPPKSVQYAYLA